MIQIPYSTGCFKIDDTNTMDFNDFDKIFQKYLGIKFNWVIRGHSTQPTLNKKNAIKCQFSGMCYLD